MNATEWLIAGFTLATLFLLVMTVRSKKSERIGFISLFSLFFGISAIMWIQYTGNGGILKDNAIVLMIIAAISAPAIMLGIITGASFSEEPKNNFVQ